jgi:UDP-glucose 4-epimerase
MRRVQPAGVVHLAGKKSPTESMADPLLYARENAGGVVSLVEALQATGCTRVVFSSSCSVYGTPDLDLVDEDSPTLPESPYGESKLYGERVLDASAAAYGLGVVNLRYFNVVGAAAPELRDTGAYNLVPLVFRALRKGETAKVFGGDYPTADGTCVRDYVDVRDLADAHVRAAEALEEGLRTATYNVGRGEGSSVLEVLDVVRAVTGRPLTHEVVERRPGDPARIVGRVDRITEDLGWRARHDLADMVRSAWEAGTGARVLH